MNNKKGYIFITVGILLVFLGAAILMSPSGTKEQKVTKAPVAEKQATTAKAPIETKAKETNENVDKGKDFEDYIIAKFDFSRKSLTLKNRNSKSATKPDLEIELTVSNKLVNFGIECAWRKELSSSGIEWANEDKVENFKAYTKDTKTPIYLVLGVGGTPNKPKDIYIVPFAEKPFGTIYTSILEKHKCQSLDGKFFYDAKTKTLTIK